MKMQILTTSESAEWMQVVEQSSRHDFYHLPQYHALAEDCGEGEAVLFHHAEGDYSIALPLLLRSLGDVPGVGRRGADWQDATSVYGYAGPLASHENVPGTVVRNFQASLQKSLHDMGVVTVFSRLHPILRQHSLLAGLGECKTLSQTVSIDLTLRSEDQRAAFRKSHKDGINRLRRVGVECVHDYEGVYLEPFVELYYETMRRVGAGPGYFFPMRYFRDLAATLGERFHLFVCVHEGRVLCGGVFIECCGILQYHLGGTLDDALKLAPMKLIFDETRIWANNRNLTLYHLGGGATTSPDDSLLHFKRGFSPRMHDFSVWRWVLIPDVYRQLCLQTSRWNQQNGLVPAQSGYFPEYRTPATRVVLPAPYLVSAEANAADAARN